LTNYHSIILYLKNISYIREWYAMFLFGLILMIDKSSFKQPLIVVDFSSQRFNIVMLSLYEGMTVG
jgi:hypothetical protein